MKVFYIPLLFSLLAACGRNEQQTARNLLPPAKRNLSGLSETLRKRISGDTSYLEYIFRGHGLTDIRSLDSSIRVDLRYAGTGNFSGRNLYDGLRRAYFPCEVAWRLCNAQHFLKKADPRFRLCILDATRPLHVQQMMWDSLDLPPGRKFNYLAAPSSVSLHNYGCAVDLTIVDASTGRELDMGTAFDTFDRLSEPALEALHTARGELSDTVLQNRRLLRYVMKRAGFQPISSEWWHFNYCSKEQAAARFSLVK